MSATDHSVEGEAGKVSADTARLKIVMSLFAMALTVSGCWSAREIDELAFIMGIAVDKSEGGGLIVTYRVVNPVLLTSGESGGIQSGGSTPSETTFVISIEAPSLTHAMERFQAQIPRRPFLSHLQTIIIGESLARDGIATIMDFFERDPELRRSMNVSIARGMDASQLFLGSKPVLVTPSGMTIDGLLEHAKLVGVSPVSTLGDVVDSIGSDRRDPYMTAVTLVPSTVDGEEKTQVRLAGAAIFRDDQLVGFLDEDESAAFLIARNELDATVLSISGEIDADVRLNHIYTNLRLKSADNLHFHMTSRQHGTIRQARILNRQNAIQAVNELGFSLEEEIKNRVHAVIKKTQAMGSDALGLGDVLYQSAPHMWHDLRHDWRSLLANTTIDINVHVTVTSIGSVIHGLQLPGHGHGDASLEGRD